MVRDVVSLCTYLLERRADRLFDLSVVKAAIYKWHMAVLALPRQPKEKDTTT